MVRTQVYLSAEEHKGLKGLSRRTGRSQSELIRTAVDRLIDMFSGSTRISKLKQARGLWENRKDLPDFKALRQEMDRNIG